MGKEEGHKCFHVSINTDKNLVLLVEGLGPQLLMWGPSEWRSGTASCGYSDLTPEPGLPCLQTRLRR